jgi:hypothetical protein
VEAVARVPNNSNQGAEGHEDVQEGDEGVGREGDCARQELPQHGNVSARARFEVDSKTDVDSASSTLSV